MSKWFVLAKKADFNKIAEKYHIDPVVARIIRNREVVTEDEIDKYLYGTIEDMYPYSLLKDVDKAIDILQRKIVEGKPIRIIGDYDVDGICSTYILYKGLSICGAKADIVIPHRIKDGYGINEHLIENAIQDEIDTIITCDNGIAAIEAFSFAKEAGITCIITDHHEVSYEKVEGERAYILPYADAIVDPKQPGCQYPFKNICGAVVAFKLIEGIFEKLSIDDCNKKELLEFAGFATICDVMELRDENRILVKTSLKYMSHSDNYGLQALIKVNKLDSRNISSYHIGFILGPCLNATGRLDTAQIALELLKSKSLEEAIPKAMKLKELNDSRKEMTEQGIEKAIDFIEKNQIQDDSVIVVYLPDLHESLAGIIAGRIRERYNKPTFVITKGEEELKGSARSIKAYNIYEEMTKCKELFIKYGGHKLAAGFSLKEENLLDFKEKINELCMLTPQDYEEKIVIDVPMPLSYVSMNLIQQLSILEPFGPGNEKPVFAQKNLLFLNGNIMGKNKNMARFLVADEAGEKFTILLFRELDYFKTYVSEKYGTKTCDSLFEDNNASHEIKLDVIYYPSINEYRGNMDIQFIMQDYR